MKKLLFVFLASVFVLKAVAQPVLNAPSTPGKNETLYNSKKPRMSAVTITGICLVSTGPVVGLAGMLATIRGSEKTANNEHRGINGGLALVGAGAGMTIAGIAMCIVGGIRDHRKARNNSMSFIAPKSNEVGIAWNF